MKKTFFSTIFAFAMAGAVQAAPIDFADMTLNGNASLVGGNLQLTPSLNSRRGSAFTDAIAIDATTTFSAAIEFDISANGGGGADGIVFVVQNSGAGANALGVGGGGIGYQNIGNSIAVELDTWNNGSIDGGSNNHVGINLNGSMNSVERANAPFNLQGAGTGFLWVDYDGTQLDVFLSSTSVRPGTAILSRDVDLTGLGTEAHFGFTASTGAARSLHRILDFDLDVTSVAPVPLPAGLPLLVVGLAAFGLVARRKS
jgi:hypothetical protein